MRWRRCIGLAGDRDCPNPPEGTKTPWCHDHNQKRIREITQQLESLSGAAQEGEK